MVYFDDKNNRILTPVEMERRAVIIRNALLKLGLLSTRIEKGATAGSEGVAIAGRPYHAGFIVNELKKIWTIGNSLGDGICSLPKLDKSGDMLVLATGPVSRTLHSFPDLVHKTTETWRQLFIAYEIAIAITRNWTKPNYASHKFKVYDLAIRQDCLPVLHQFFPHFKFFPGMEVPSEELVADQKGSRLLYCPGVNTELLYKIIKANFNIPGRNSKLTIIGRHTNLAHFNQLMFHNVEQLIPLHEHFVESDINQGIYSLVAIHKQHQTEFYQELRDAGYESWEQVTQEMKDDLALNRFRAVPKNSPAMPEYSARHPNHAQVAKEYETANNGLANPKRAMDEAKAMRTARFDRLTQLGTRLA